MARHEVKIPDLPGEIWKDIKGYEDSYQVSNMGRIKSKSRFNSAGNRLKGRIIKQIRVKYNTNNIYFAISLCCDGKPNQYKTSRLVIEAFVGKINEHQVVIHLDGDNSNNRLDNLKISSRSDVSKILINGHKWQFILDSLISGRQKSTKPIEQLDFNGNVITELCGAIEAKRRFGFNQSNIAKACRGRQKTAHGFKWRYKDDI